MFTMVANDFALVMSREPMIVGIPAFANLPAIALPSLPVPPIMAIVGFGFGVDI
jgi:hypothetical protein